MWAVSRKARSWESRVEVQTLQTSCFYTFFFPVPLRNHRVALHPHTLLRDNVLNVSFLFTEGNLRAFELHFFIHLRGPGVPDFWGVHT